MPPSNRINIVFRYRRYYGMTIYWERCSICGRYHVLKQCTLNQDLLVCPHCCIACPKRSICHKPAWYAKLAVKTVAKPKKEAEKVFLELLDMLESTG